jgi:hydroxymethylbilane synthase
MARTGTAITIGTRGSQLALWQAHHIREELGRHFPQLTINVEIIKTTGDKILDSPLSSIGDKGLFTREIEHALLDGRIDLAVHSLKDLPTVLPDGLKIAAITAREDVRDVFISHPAKNHTGIDSLPLNAVIATGSLRRKCQLLNWRPDIRIVDIRGNLNTRFAKLETSGWDGMILARAGVVRLGFEERISETIPLERILPAVGQGALGIETRQNDAAIMKFIAPLASEAATISAKAERAFLRELEGGCQVPIGAYAYVEENRFIMSGLIGSLDGKRIVRGKTEGPTGEADERGRDLARVLYNSGGKAILDEILQIARPQPAKL